MDANLRCVGGVCWLFSGLFKGNIVMAFIYIIIVIIILIMIELLYSLKSFYWWWCLLIDYVAQYGWEHDSDVIKLAFIWKLN